MNDAQYMNLALELAKKGAGWTSPNPMVGAVIVKDGEIIGEGWHERCGDLHAERNALKHCTADPAGATMYVTLEPCCHTGRQPPCVEAIIEAKIARVVIASPDPNSLVAGKGVEILRSHGIDVTEGVLLEECDRVNDVFFHYIRTGLPFVALKWAMTMDGKIAACTGDSKWVTGPEARAHVQTLRNRYRAILVGIGTVLADDPMLNCRMEGGRDPIRIICDANLRTPLCSQVVQTAKQVPTVIVTCCKDNHKPYLDAGCHVFYCPSDEENIDIKRLMELLGANDVDSVLVEGGGTMHWSFLKAGLVNKVYTYIAPKLVGGRDAKSPIEGEGFPYMASALPLVNTQIRPIGGDILLESEVSPDVYGNR